MNVLNVNSTCPNCGAPVEIDKGSQAFVCKYCSSIVAIVSNESSSTQSDQSSTPVLRKVEPELKFAANHQVSAINSQGGHLWITKDEVVFKPHAINFGPMGKRYIRIQDVVGYKKGLLTHMSIFTKSGYEMDLVVWNKDEIINEIERRRVNFYKSQGLPIPPLKYSEGVRDVSYNTNDTGYSPNGGKSAEQMSSNAGCLGVIVAFIISASAVLYSIIC